MTVLLKPFPKRGVTLVEIVLSFLILVIATLAASGLISFGHRGTHKDYRTIAAQNFLTDRMNQILLVPFASLTTSITSEPTLFSADGAEGRSLWGVPYGLASDSKGGNFNVDISIQHIPLTFGLRPVDVLNAPTYDPRVPSTFNFGNFDSAFAIFDGSSAQRAYQVIKIITTVKWTEQNGVRKRIELVSFTANLEGAT